VNESVVAASCHPIVGERTADKALPRLQSGHSVFHHTVPLRHAVIEHGSRSGASCGSGARSLLAAGTFVSSGIEAAEAMQRYQRLGLLFAGVVMIKRDRAYARPRAQVRWQDSIGRVPAKSPNWTCASEEPRLHQGITNAVMIIYVLPMTTGQRRN
jgi:hypothetical protein